MRVGVGNKTHGTLADYVLSRLSEDEIKQSSHLFDRAVAALEVWIEEGIVKAMQIANGRQEEKTPESNVGE
jgi:peptidyl-tRNA hydrolase